MTIKHRKLLRIEICGELFSSEHFTRNLKSIALLIKTFFSLLHNVVKGKRKMDMYNDLCLNSIFSLFLRKDVLSEKV